MHDARWFEAAGIPACAVVSNGFMKQARYQAKILESSMIPQVFVPHPISDQTMKQMHAKAEASFDEVFHAITQAWSPPLCDNDVAMAHDIKSRDQKDCES